MKQTSRLRSGRRAPSCLAENGWAPAVRRHLEDWIRREGGRGLAVALDFDNTLVCGDIGEATLAILVREGRLDADRLSPALVPSFRSPAGSQVAARALSDLTEYYEALLAPTVHGPADPTPLAGGYVWAVEVMEGLRVTDVIQATTQAYRLAQPGSLQPIEVTPGKTAYPAPFFYPPMVELLATLLKNGFSLWIVSASNVWSVRWMVREVLNPMLRQLGAPQGIPPQQIAGVSVLLQDRHGRLHKDACLVRENAAYARLDPAALKALRLTRWLEFPVPTYSGKVGFLWDVLGGRPELAAGDSPGDHPMLAFARRRLWIARLDKPDYQKATLNVIRRTGSEGWLVQSVLGRDQPGFVEDVSSLPPLPESLGVKVRRSVRLLRRLSPQAF